MASELNVGTVTATGSVSTGSGSSTPAAATPYIYANGLRLSGGDTANTIYNAGRNIGIKTTGGGMQITAGSGLATFTNGIAFSGQTDTSATGAAATSTTLDHYEEGTWTPAWSPATGAFSAVTYRFQVGKYTRIGRAVYIECQIASDSITVDTGADAIRVSGLPFTAGATTSGGIALSTSTAWAADFPNAVNVSPSSTLLRLLYRTGVGTTTQVSQVTDLSTATNYGNTLEFGGVYFV